MAPAFLSRHLAPKACAASSIMLASYCSARLANLSMLAHCPYRCTGITARIGDERPRCSALSVASGSRFRVAGSMSARIGVAPQRKIELTVAKKLNGVVITHASGPTPAAARASQQASVPDAQPTLALAPRQLADSRSKT